LQLQMANLSIPTTSPPGVLAPACEEAGVAWAGFHTFRHTVASRLFADGRNIVQVQHWLGHHSPSFTLAPTCISSTGTSGHHWRHSRDEQQHRAANTPLTLTDSLQPLDRKPRALAPSVAGYRAAS
jgi:integrase